jgi:hypothetical protein
MGEERSYNVAGEHNASNWTLRVPAAFRDVHARRAAAGRAFDVAGALARRAPAP